MLDMHLQSTLNFPSHLTIQDAYVNLDAVALSTNVTPIVQVESVLEDGEEEGNSKSKYNCCGRI